ncbi:ash family protein [Pasteurellaceae bacterium TAE3-ERU1]|nr:ash family protein [Pasteurellaceae bacterium TAE3-ERU1]
MRSTHLRAVKIRFSMMACSGQPFGWLGLPLFVQFSTPLHAIAQAVESQAIAEIE